MMCMTYEPSLWPAHTHLFVLQLKLARPTTLPLMIAAGIAVEEEMDKSTHSFVLDKCLTYIIVCQS